MNATAERRAKWQRLEHFRRRLPHVSQSALVATLAAVEKLGLPEAATRENLRAARDACAHQRGNYGPLMKEINLHTTSGESKLNIVSLSARFWT